MRTELLQKAKQILNDAINEVRILSKNLVASNVKEIGLIESVNDLIDTINPHKYLNVDFQTKGFTEKLPNKAKLMLFRIIQEQLNNIQKHAFAKNIIINLSVSKENITLYIYDDGKGFDPNKKKKGIGLSNITSRAEFYKGNVEITSAVDKGCKLNVRVPLKEIYQK